MMLDSQGREREGGDAAACRSLTFHRGYCEDVVKMVECIMRFYHYTYSVQHTVEYEYLHHFLVSAEFNANISRSLPIVLVLYV